MEEGAIIKENMDLLAIAEPALCIQGEERISQAISRMVGGQRHELLVFEGKVFKGIITAGDLVERNIRDPHGTKLSSMKGLLQRTKLFTPQSSPKELIDFILMRAHKSVPLVSEGRYYTIPKVNLIRFLRKDALRKTAADIMFFPYSISSTDTLAVAQSIFRDLHISRLVVLGKEGRVEGILDALNILKFAISFTRTKRGDLAGEKVSVKEVIASSPPFLTVNFPRVSPETPLSIVVKKMLEAKNTTVVVDDGAFQGIITPTNILKLHGSEIEGVSVTITGQQEEDTFLKSVIDEQIRNEIRKLGRIIPIDYLTLHIGRHSEAGKRKKYTVKARLITEKGMFFAHDYAWDLTQAVHGVLKRLEREAVKKVEKKRTYQRRRV